MAESSLERIEGGGKPAPPHLIERFLENQSKELDLRVRELALGQQKDNNAYKFGKEALTVKAADRRDQRLHERQIRLATYWFLGFLILFFFGLLFYALHLGRDVFAMEIIKAVVFLLSGGAGGYGLSTSRQRGTPEDPKKTDPT